MERPPRRPAVGSALRRSAEDAEAFRDFYVANVQRVVVFFTRRTLNAEVALDLTGETFAVALQRRRQFRGGTDAEAEAWLFAIARSQLSHFWRRGVAERRALEQIGIDAPSVAQLELERIEEIAGLPDLRRRVQRAIAALHPQQAYAVTQRVVAEREYDDLARELGVSQDVVRARVSRGLRALAASRGLSAAA
ncbi:MAG TPA: RNA polymerase sigma factor [Baekduia sp.]|nr:RNA polymerase sigma factor [Baekduia sp.]